MLIDVVGERPYCARSAAQLAQCLLKVPGAGGIAAHCLLSGTSGRIDVLRRPAQLLHRRARTCKGWGDLRTCVVQRAIELTQWLVAKEAAGK